MTLTKAQKDFVVNRLKSQWRQVKLKCDGFEVTLGLIQVTDTKLAVEIYINNFFKGTWVLNPEKHIESKFLPIRYLWLWSPKEKKEILKKFGKRAAYKNFPDLDKRLEHKTTHFTSGRAAINHLIKVCDSIELITEIPG
ncbi:MULTISPECIES: hypothetical protein [unclassified Acinetobacter]|uniref:hypothetical protein n=1 Tax=unclassified Acinetobacter TaxID=196816 RepID=UPI00190CC1E1|nr:MULTISPECIES: hypothetical protein [unclassified Acinetobacter]MBK0062405.1 hypothetical protein [Acinetobacter sp. S55]MBK0066209.1 hypothetical protein [Acinetobacter sp. S54]